MRVCCLEFIPHGNKRRLLIRILLLLLIIANFLAFIKQPSLGMVIQLLAQGAQFIYEEGSKVRLLLFLMIYYVVHNVSYRTKSISQEIKSAGSVLHGVKHLLGQQLI